MVDANNVNGVNNDGIADGSDQDIVFDLSPHQNDTTPYLNRSDYRPTLRKGVLNGKDVLEFAGPLDVLVTKNDLGVADINENSEISLFVVATISDITMLVYFICQVEKWKCTGKKVAVVVVICVFA